MAIRQRGNCYQVTYRCPGEKSPRTETFHTEEEAVIREAQIRLMKKNGNFEPPVRAAKGIIKNTNREVTLQEFLEEYIEVYGLKKWGNSVYNNNISLIKHYIDPYIGDRYICTISTRDLDGYYSMLLDKPAVILPGHLDIGKKISADTIGKIHKLLKSAFGKAVVWDYLPGNPAIGATLPERRIVKRSTWSDAEALTALNACENQVLRICLYLAIGCSMRLGEILALQWSNVHVEESHVLASEAYIAVDKELQRCSNKSIEVLEKVHRSTIIFKFPHIMPRKASTTLVLKAPKTESSNRIIYLPMAVVEELKKVKEQQATYKAMLGDEYLDYNLVVAQVNGRPYELRIIDKLFYQLIKANNLSPVVFHSLRHCSTSLKLKLSHGNIKAVQGDTGHAEARMVTDTYAHSFDTDRKQIAQEMDAGFFSKMKTDNQEPQPTPDLQALIALSKQHPELLAELMKKMQEKLAAESAL